MKTQRDQVAGAAAILEWFTGENPAFERNASRRILAEVMRAWPGDAHDLWWKWFSEAATSLGHRTKTLDCSLEQAVTLVGDEARIICYRDSDDEPGGGEWLAVVGATRNGFQVVLASNQHVTEMQNARALRKTLRRFLRGGRIRCCVMLSSEAAVSSSYSGPNGHRFRPLERLWQLMRPEAPDIWLVVVFSFVVSALMLATPIAVEALVNTVAFGRFLQPIIVLALILLTFLGFRGAVRALQTYVVEIIQRRLFARVAGDLAFRLPRTEVEASDDEYLPELTNRFFDIVTTQKVLAQLLLDGLGLVLSTLIGMAVLGFYHPWLLGFDVFLSAVILVIIFVLGRGAVASAVKESKHKYFMAGWLEDVARCQTAFRNEGGAEFALERADRLIHEYLTARRDHFAIVMRQVLFALGLQAISSTLLLGLGGWLVISGELTLGQLVAAELIVTIIVGSFAKFGKHMESFYDLLASVDKLGVLFDLPMERVDGMLSINRTQPCSVTLSNLSYAWPNQPALFEGLTAEIRPGESVALLASAGTGKSTLMDIMFGARNPLVGHLTIDGFDPRDLRPDVLRDRVAMARGEEVFHASIAENVHLHREGVTATDVRDTLAPLGLLEFVMRYSDGLDTMLNSSGAPLSESQRRLLGVARAAVGRPGLLLIDGALDTLGADDLRNCLDFLLVPERSWTVVIATSREEIAVLCDRTLSLSSATVASS